MERVVHPFWDVPPLEGGRAESATSRPAPAPWSADGTWYHTVDCSQGELRSQHKDNLAALYQKLQDIGFTEVHLRFAQQSNADVDTWPAWDQAQYEQNQSFILNTVYFSESVKAT